VSTDPAPVEIWVDAHLSPSLAAWISEHAPATATSVQRLGLRDARDEDIFAAARAAGSVVMTKDADFVRLVRQHGPPPRVLWLTFGNTSNAHVRDVLATTLRPALALLAQGEALVEIGQRPAGVST